MDKMVNSIQTSMDTTVDRFNSEVKGYIRRRKVSTITWVGVIILSTANFLSMATFSAPGWGWTHEIAGSIKIAGEYHGLYAVWYICWMDTDAKNLGMCDEWRDFDTGNKPAWIPAFQALSVMVLLCGLASFFVQMAYICIPSANKHTTVLLSFAGVALLTGIFTCSQWLTFLVGFLKDAWYCCKPEMVRQILDYRLSYCFVLSCICSGAYFLTTIVSVYEWAGMRKRQKEANALLTSAV